MKKTSMSKNEKLLSPSNWFKPNKSKQAAKNRKNKKKTNTTDPEVVTVLFVSQTPGGKLSKQLQKVEERISKLTNEKVRMVERAGRTVKQLLGWRSMWQRVVSPLSRLRWKARLQR